MPEAKVAPGRSLNEDAHLVVADCPAFGKLRIDGRAVRGVERDKPLINIGQHLNGLAAGDGGRVERQDVRHREADDELICWRVGHRWRR